MRGPRARVLVVDDDPDVLARLNQLGGERWEFVGVSDANLAVQRASAERWDLLLVDVNLLILRGDRLVRVLQERTPAHARAPILYFSADDEARLARLARETGVAGHVSKGRRNAEILEALAAHLPGG